MNFGTTMESIEVKEQPPQEVAIKLALVGLVIWLLVRNL